MINRMMKIVTDPAYRFKKLSNKGIYDRLSDEKYVSKKYKALTGKKLNLDNPCTFNEKIQWLKVNYHNQLYTKMVDKCEVKDFVEKKIGTQYVVPLLGVWDKYEDIDFDQLPDQFVLKVTHDSGGLVICRDKRTLNMEVTKRIITNSLKRDYYLSVREWPYKNVKRRIIAEQYLENGDEGLHDYKIWCFNGRVEYIQYITGRLKDTFEAFYDREWNKQKFSYHNPLLEGNVKKPERIDELIVLAERLAKDTPFARIDFYVLENGDIKFGEITFYPMSGLDIWKPEIMNKKLGDLIHLPTSIIK